MSNLFRIRDSELPADFPRQQVRDLRVAWHRGYAARISEIDVLAVLSPFLDKHAAISFKMADQLPPFHSHLDLFDHNLTFWKLG